MGEHPPLGITMGDPAGIGPEIVARLFADGAEVPCIVYGAAAAIRRAAGVIGKSLDVRTIPEPEAARPAPGVIEVVACADVPYDLPYGRIDARAGAAAHACIVRAADDAMAGRVGAVVTAPIHKEALYAAGVKFPGHTELLADRAGATEFAMMMANDELRVVLVSIHLSLAEAVRAVTPDAERRAIRLADEAGRAFGFARPRVAVAGLNPHAGEGGNFGREDIDIIAPAIAEARAAGIDASGPHPGDTVFMRARAGDFDVVVAQYHDQGLIPVKYLGVEQGVNITLGLPFVRTSVDHGTAFDIAGTGRASAASLHAAVRQAARLARHHRGRQASG